MFLRRPLEQSLSDKVGARKRAAREMLFSLAGYDLTARRTKAGDDTKGADELRNQLVRARVTLSTDSENNVLCASRVQLTKDRAYSRCKDSGRFDELAKEF